MQHASHSATCIFLSAPRIDKPRRFAPKQVKIMTLWTSVGREEVPIRKSFQKKGRRVRSGRGGKVSLNARRDDLGVDRLAAGHLVVDPLIGLFQAVAEL